ncbi:type III PLP-dependent enzyme [Rhizobium rhizogenes]|uniref:type III PLP-dependent enzyme n=1 Tax=Rhizobium rhizogenes TaxID=359 RepID=UPI0024BDF3EF|nr:type III PLP-dependent enzyme [Rhizobium rhizogenes]MDJ1638184.1 type III PLP-dependent enzyme [Rhizobium rhizogenes]
MGETGRFKADWRSLESLAARVDTPCYVYDLDVIEARLKYLRDMFPPSLTISFAVKSNPNSSLLFYLNQLGVHFDASSIGEVRNALDSGANVEGISFSGPAKRHQEIAEFVRLRSGTLVIESIEEAVAAGAIAVDLGFSQRILVRISPAWVPPRFGAPMAGRASQFGFDEETLKEAISQLQAIAGITIAGFHILSGTGCLDHNALSETFDYNLALASKADNYLRTPSSQIVLGAGFGIPYGRDDREVDLAAVSERFSASLTTHFHHRPVPQLSLEMGRWLVGPAGWFLTRVVSQKESRGVSFRICDGGFNNHLAAAGMLGSVLRRNWQIENLSNPTGETKTITLAGPLCTSFDLLARQIELSDVRVGDVLAIKNSGAYGLTASPFHFISHPKPRERFIGGYSSLSSGGLHESN